VGNADHEDLVLINALLRSELARLRAECEAAKKERQESINHMNSVFEQWVKMGEERDAERARADAAEAKLAPIIKLAKRLMRSLDGHGSDGLPLILDVNHFSSTPAIFTLADCKRLAAEGSK
jgi:hypothetical protein